MKDIPLAIAAALTLLAGAGFATLQGSDTGAANEEHATAIERGRYLAVISGCNDCHTRGYAERAGDVPESDWLTGDQLGWQGPWGTTYPPNLRRLMAGLQEDEWLTYAKTVQLRPPMPWYQLRAMTDADLRAIYQFIRALGPAGAPAPAYQPPGEKVAGPVVIFPGAGPAPLAQR
jgi:mono/diheme cytochrome c family protein